MSFEPAASWVSANGLSHHVLTWNDGGQPTIVLCHGFLDMAHGFEWVADALAAAGFRVVAFDFRGHGRTEWVGRGGYYHFADYVLDLASLLPLVADAPVHLVGHSMGGTVACLFAGTRPNAIRSLTLVEGLGPPAMTPEDTPHRLRAFLDGVERARSQPPRPMASIDDAVARLRVQHPALSPERARLLAERATITAEDGCRWRFDPLHRTMSPTPFVLAAFLPILAAITAPTLVVAGEKGFRLADERTRIDALPRHQFLELPDVGHMIHWFAPDALAAAIVDHVRAHA
jgi:pimeloyl-ACP methyl ester carboxylesterase